jgi:ABC-type branched-subunit amino acid transport system substrate-binding protein
VTAQALASYLINSARQQKVAVFYNPQSNYSKSLREQFGISFQASGGQIVQEFDLSDSFFMAGAAIHQAHRQGGTALVLLPDGQTGSNAFRNVLKAIKANQGRYLMVGGDSLYNSEILEIGGKDAANRLVVAIPWHRLSSPNPEFPLSAQKLWGGEVSWRTALAYDATRASITALEKQPQPNRIGVQQALVDPNFEAKGATGVIHFREKGDRREPNIQLVKVIPSKGGDDYVFVPVK